MGNKLTNNHANVHNTKDEPLRKWVGSAILLLDLDAFFASVEQLDHPEWKGKPVIVGGSPEKRGVVLTASYEARKYGVHSAMASQTAKKLCPNAVWTNGNFHRYREISKQVMKILYNESPHLMQVSIDEAFLDISPTRINKEHPVVIAKRIQKQVSKLGITCSIGVGTSKAIAKIASNMNKPHGLTVIYPGEERAFLAPLPIKEMSGIGPVAQVSLRKFGIHTLGDVAHADIGILKKVFGKNADMMRLRCVGVDTPIIDSPEPAKSISNEISLAKSTANRIDLEALIATSAHKVGRRLRLKGVEGSTLHLKIRFENLTRKTCQKRISDLGTNELVWLPYLYSMLDEIWDGCELVRLIGVGVSDFNGKPVQASLFENGPSLKNESPLITNAKKNKKLLETTDAIAEKFGEDLVQFGHEIRIKGGTTGSSSKNPHDYKD